MKPILRCLLAGILGLSTLSCGKDDPSSGDGNRQALTYWQDVAPIFFDNCVVCHQNGGIGPFALDNFADAKLWADVAARATAARTMPPWLVRDDGSCGTFQHSRALSDAEIDTIRVWAEGGAPEGEPRTDLTLPELPTLANAVEYSTPNFAPVPVGGQIAQFDEYRCFETDLQLQETKYLTGYDILPGNPALVHHVLVMVVDPAAPSEIPGRTNRQVMDSLDLDSPDRDGWPCFGLAGEGVAAQGVPVAWAPGQGIVEFPPDTGYRLSVGDVMVTQVHYNMSRPELLGQTDQSTVRVRLVDQVARPGFFDLPDGLLDTLFDGNPTLLAPGRESVEYRWEMDLDRYLPPSPPQAELLGIFPHMHERGREMKIEIIEPGGEETCVAEVPNWDFGWQIYYFYQNPIPLRPGQRLRVTCNFDTRGVTEPIAPGWGTQNEMCLAGVFVAP